MLPFLAGGDKFELRISSLQVVADLLNGIEKITEVPVNYQRVIYNGRTINGKSEDLNMDLRSFGLKSPAKILVFGKKPDEEDGNYKLMKNSQVCCDSASLKLSSLQNVIQDMEKVIISTFLLSTIELINNLYILGLFS